MTIDEIFNAKLTENGDLAFKKASDNTLINIFFLSEYYQNHPLEIPYLEPNDKNRLFSMFIRDPRFGIGRRDLGRHLMDQTKCSFDEILNAGRADDLFFNLQSKSIEEQKNLFEYLYVQIQYKNNNLIKKWMPRYSSKNLMLARQIAKEWKVNKQTYGKLIKCDTTEYKLSTHNEDTINFEQVPSLAMVKYAKAFSTKESTKERYAKYLEDVKAGKKDLKVSTTSVYDIYKNRYKIDADLFFSKIKRIKINCIPIVDTSGSMFDFNDSIGKALSIGHYLSKCSTYMPNKVITFSDNPALIQLGEVQDFRYRNNLKFDNNYPNIQDENSQYQREINSMVTGEVGSTNFGKVMEMLSLLDGNMPEYLVVLSDMEFNIGSSLSKAETMNLFKSKGYNTKIIWWNFNSRNTTCPEMDNYGNIFLSGYNPFLLKYLESGFNAAEFLENLLVEYAKNLHIEYTNDR